MLCQEGEEEKDESYGAGAVEPRNRRWHLHRHLHRIGHRVVLNHFHDLVTVEVLQYRVGHKPHPRPLSRERGELEDAMNGVALKLLTG